MKPCVFFLLALTALLSCNGLVKNKESANQSPAQKTTSNTTPAESDAEVLNNVTVRESGGLQVAKAYLSFEDGTLLPKTNRAKVGQTVYLNLLVDKGWTVKDGFVSLDASERIETADGRLVLNAPNLYKALPQIEEEKAAHLFLKATITATQPDIDHFVVNYHVWDKQGNGEIKGRYLLYVDGQ